MAERYEIERKRQFVGDLEAFIAQLDSRDFSWLAKLPKLIVIILDRMLILCRRLSVCGFGSVMILLR